MPTYRFYQLDVFTNRPLAGNPLAVLPDAAGLEPNEMQALAREMNLSETSFVFPSDKATQRLRFFTPTAEVPLPGHPTVGTWWLLAALGRLDLPQDGVTRVTQETEAGIVPVDIQMAGGAPTQVVMAQPLPEFGEYVADTGPLARALGGGPDLIPDGPAPQVISTGIPQLMIPTCSLEVLKALPSGGGGAELAGLLRKLGTDCAMCYSLETESAGATVHCRMFAPGLGVPEDPATGSASGALGSYLVWHGVVAPHDGTASIVVEQGIEIDRPSQIHVEITSGMGGEITEVRVGGEAVIIIEGEVQL
ncbi:MAG: PhzF family phenazine biosynthesis isomerase [Gemmatimonadales bacterium]|nr:PhzF family phenazine biosynthesis isomerase [Gemmatimonadales bacterium]NIN10774.1 PhzF family phenazine biosynthesis isomerase [Gemmatimonadales bacterium]NIQ99004.1 PhzF family phenazine biosynthesis isomerase [Gemmatimonadales bacterium]NIS63823.1 PhzF family phenazine biosynthesis isomerase [Gemmatimonadales bacterium]